MKGIIFDLDGTLLDSMGMWSALDRRFLRGHGIEPPEDISEIVKSMTTAESSAYFAARFPLGMTAEEISSEVMALADRAYREELPLKDGAKAFLRALRTRGIPFGIASVTYPELLEAVLNRTGVQEMFRFVLTPDDHHGKHAPAIFLRAAALLDAQPWEIVVIEDSLYAARTAKSAGFYTIGFRDPFSANEWGALAEICDRTIDGWHELSDPAFFAMFHS